MKSGYLVILVLLSISLRAAAIELKIGANLTHIKATNSKGQAGISFGVFREWRIWRQIFLDGEVLFTSKRAILENKRIHFYPGVINTYDIHCSYGFIELPILLKLYVPLKDDITLYIQGGPSLSLGLYDNSSKEKRLDVYSISPEEYDGSNFYDYDYGEIFDPGVIWPYILLNSPVGLNLGVGVNFSNYGFEVRYHRSNIGSAYTDGSLIKLEENYYTIQCLMIVLF